MPEAFTLLFALAILYWFYIVEAVLVLLAYRFSRTNPDLGRRWFVAAEQWLGQMARWRGLSVVAIGVLALGGRAALAPFLPIRQPLVTDDQVTSMVAIYLAYDRGYFKDEGLDVELMVSSDRSQDVQLLATNQAEFIVTLPDPVIQRTTDQTLRTGRPRA